MSRVFEAIRQAQEKARERERLLQTPSPDGSPPPTVVTDAHAEPEMYSGVSALSNCDLAVERAGLEANLLHLRILIGRAEQTRRDLALDLEAIQRRIQVLTKEAVHAASTELRTGAKREAESASRQAVEKIKNQVEECIAACRDLSRMAEKELEQSSVESVRQHAQELVDFSAAELSNTKAHLNEVLQLCVEEFSERAKAAGEEVLGRKQEQISRDLTGLMDSLLEQHAGRVQEESESAVSILRQVSEQLRTENRDDLARAQVEFQESLEKSRKAANDQLIASVQSGISSKSGLAESVLDTNRQRLAGEELFRGEVKAAIQEMKEEISRAQSETLAVIESQRSISLNSLDLATRGAWEALHAQKKDLHDAIEQMRLDLITKIAAGLQSTLDAQRAAFVGHFQTEAERMSGKVADQLKLNAADVSRLECERVTQHTDLILLVLKNWIERFNCNLESGLKNTLSEFERQTASISTSRLKKQRDDADAVMEQVHRRLLQAAGLIQGIESPAK